MQESSKVVVLEILRNLSPKDLLDAPCGDGWLSNKLESSVSISIDGIDLYAKPNSKYKVLKSYDLNNGIPSEMGQYDCIVSCEGLEHFGNPELFLRSSYNHLKPNGTILISTPNTWYPQAKIQYLLRGFFPSFPCLLGKVNPGEHMHILPWSLPQLYLFLELAGFRNIRVHYEPLSEARHFYEKIIALPQYFYCLNKLKKSVVAENKIYWQALLSKSSLFGRHLIVTAEKL
jgi:SAM-dependent methyltransferase